MPVMHLLVGPNGAGKTTLFERVLSPITHLPFINADVLARQQAIAQGLSFVAEAVFSHPSKLQLLRDALGAGYIVHLHVVLVPEALSQARVKLRAGQGGHSVPEHKVRERYQRLWPLVSQAIALAHAARVYDNSSARQPYRTVAAYENGRPVVPEDYPAWSAWRGPAAAN